MGRQKGCLNLPKVSVDSRFWDKVNKGSVDDCWEYLGRLNHDGYGQFDHHNTASVAHRFSWELSFGKIPDGIYVCHKCDNPSCVNPNHLFLGTQKDNMEDMVKKGRGADKRGRKNGKSVVNESIVREIRVLYSNGWSYQKIADNFGVSNGCVNHIINGRHWAWVK